MPPVATHRTHLWLVISDLLDCRRTLNCLVLTFPGPAQTTMPGTCYASLVTIYFYGEIYSQMEAFHQNQKLLFLKKLNELFDVVSKML